jgi:hypothetical protein
MFLLNDGIVRECVYKIEGIVREDFEKSEGIVRECVKEFLVKSNQGTCCGCSLNGEMYG